MPELPEVETIKLGLEKKIVGLTITNIQALNPRSFLGDSQEVIGKKVLKLWRRGKVLGVDLLLSLRGAKRRGNLFKNQDSHDPISSDLGMTILIHLKMSGQLVWIGKDKFLGGHPTEDMLGKMPNSHTRVIFSFSDGSNLYFNDQRKFGWVKVISSVILTSERGACCEAKDLIKMGPEPLEDGFTWQILKQNLLKHKKTPIKVAILDQSVVAGVGNIYASEACFNAKLDPRIKAGELDDNQFKRLHRGVLQSLRDGIKHGGSSKVHFVDAEGKKGYFLDYAYVYWKNGKPCKVCGSTIQKITQGGRGTFFCPTCQR